MDWGATVRPAQAVVWEAMDRQAGRLQGPHLATGSALCSPSFSSALGSSACTMSEIRRLRSTVSVSCFILCLHPGHPQFLKILWSSFHIQIRWLEFPCHTQGAYYLMHPEFSGVFLLQGPRLPLVTGVFSDQLPHSGEAQALLSEVSQQGLGTWFDWRLQGEGYGWGAVASEGTAGGVYTLNCRLPCFEISRAFLNSGHFFRSHHLPLGRLLMASACTLFLKTFLGFLGLPPSGVPRLRHPSLSSCQVNMS